MNNTGFRNRYTVQQMNTDQMDGTKERRWVVLLILLVSALRLFAAVTVELGNDEVYYRMYADTLQWNYFDHPPFVAWVIRFFTINLAADFDVIIRMGSMVFAAAATWMLFRCGMLLSSARAGFLAAVLYSASIYTSIIAGTFIMPDSPQVFFWVAALYHLLRISGAGFGQRRTVNRSLLIFGVFTGLGMLCKVHTIFLWAGLGAYALFYERRLLRLPAFYGGIALMLLLFSPVIVWNIQNDFATYSFHSQRVDPASGNASAERMLTFIAGQILYCNPLVFGVLFYTLMRFRNLPLKTPQLRMLLLVSLPLIAVATAGSLFRDLFPHWTGPGFIGLMLLTGVFFAEKPFPPNRSMPRLFSAALGLLVIAVIAGSLLINRYPGTLGSKDPLRLGDGDFTLDMFGWENMGLAFDSIYRTRHKADTSKTTAVLLCDKWFPAAHLQHYVLTGLPVRLRVCGTVEDIHQYHWVNQEYPLPADSVETYRIIPSNYFSMPEQMDALRSLKPISVDTVTQYRGGWPARRFYVYAYGKIKINCAENRP